MSVSSTSTSTALSGISGYDFSGIVESLVTLYKLPETQMTKTQSTIQTQQDAWRDVNTRMSALEATLAGLSDAPTWTSTQVTTSNASLVSATTGINAVQGVYNIKVLNNAQAQTVTSTLQAIASPTTATTLAAGAFTITTGGVAHTIAVAANDSLQTIAESINNAKAGVSATVVAVTGGYQLAMTATQTGITNAATFANVTTGTVLSDLGIVTSKTVASTLQAVASPTDATTLAAGTFSITTGGTAHTITVAANDSLQTIADSINTASAGVSASVVAVTGGYKLSMTTTTANSASFASLTGTVLADLGISNGLNVLQSAQEVQAARDASLTVNGVQNITSASNTVTSVIPGVTLNITGADNGATTVTLNVTADTSVAQTKIQAFVDQYNSTMSFISTKLSYNSTTEVAGDLCGDQTLQGIQSKLRSLVSGTFNNPTGPYLTLSSIGISTSSLNFGEDATLTFDTTKFATAMSTNAQSVANLFGAAAGGVTPSKDASNTQGLANILENYLNPLVKYGGSFATKLSGYEEQLTDIEEQIAAFEIKATAYEAAQKLKFSTLETLLAGLNSQASAITASFNALTDASET